MELEKLPGEFTVCKVLSAADLDLGGRFCFIGKTDEEISLVCRTEDTPQDTAVREDGWRGVRIRGALDFSQIGTIDGHPPITAQRLSTPEGFVQQAVGTHKMAKLQLDVANAVKHHNPGIETFLAVILAIGCPKLQCLEIKPIGFAQVALATIIGPQAVQ